MRNADETHQLAGDKQRDKRCSERMSTEPALKSFSLAARSKEPYIAGSGPDFIIASRTQGWAKCLARVAVKPLPIGDRQPLRLPSHIGPLNNAGSGQRKRIALDTGSYELWR